MTFIITIGITLLLALCATFGLLYYLRKRRENKTQNRKPTDDGKYVIEEDFHYIDFENNNGSGTKPEAESDLNLDLPEIETDSPIELD